MAQEDSLWTTGHVIEDDGAVSEGDYDNTDFH